jgi:phospholipase D-like protein
MLLPTLIAIPLILIWILTLVDVIRRRDLGKGAKSAWIIITLIVPLIGPIMYWVLRPPATSMAEREAATAAASNPSGRPSDQPRGRGGPA